MTTFSKFKTWSKRWHNLRFACWNCWSYSNERHAYCKSLGYDVLALTELRNKQNNPNFTSKFWIPSAQNTTIINSKKNEDHPRFFFDAKICGDDAPRFFKNFKLDPLRYREGRIRT